MVIDMSATIRVEADGLGGLLEARRILLGGGLWIWLAGMSNPVRRVLQFSAMADLFRIAATPAEAIRFTSVASVSVVARGRGCSVGATSGSGAERFECTECIDRTGELRMDIVGTVNAGPLRRTVAADGRIWGQMRERESTKGRIRLVPGIVCLALLASCSLCTAQDASQSGELKVNPLTALRAFEAPANDDYALGRGDEISIDFGGHPELSAKRVVGPDGRITLAPAGSILIVDETREQAAQTIQAALDPFYTRLSVTVGVDKYTSNRVLLLGAVEHPGVVSFDAPPTLLEVLTIGGGHLAIGPDEYDSRGDGRDAGGAGLDGASGALRDLSRIGPGDVGRAEEPGR